LYLYSLHFNYQVSATISTSSYKYPLAVLILSIYMLPFIAISRLPQLVAASPGSFYTPNSKLAPYHQANHTAVLPN